MHQDFQDLLTVFGEERVEYLIVGGYAVSYYARPRFTKDIDLWVRGTRENLNRTIEALRRFGVPEAVRAGLESGTDEDIVWFGVPPTRVDILRRIDGVEFDRRMPAAWKQRGVTCACRSLHLTI